MRHVSCQYPSSEYALWKDAEIRRRLEDKYASDWLLRIEKGKADEQVRNNTLITKALDDIYGQMSHFRTWTWRR